MIATGDVDRLLVHVNVVGLEPTEVTRGWPHIGAIICDAALQRQARYQSTVRPRVEKLIAIWPDADTLSGFRERMASEDLSSVLDWRGQQKLHVIDLLTETFHAAGIQTVTDLASILADDERGRAFRNALRRIRFVDPKTVAYIAVLAGSSQYTAVDVHIRRFVRDAGIEYWKDYDRVSELVAAAAKYGCSTGALDAAIWDYMSASSGASRR
ncbi:hypothetical protein F8M49_23775 [Rhodococcus zopfii]|uniref:HhH-GPD domain-containing protein n=1 Tax=Rhodococcus zopfii TaxID=43772 RepID=A0ABU3WUQ1_9NOCA|nr:hypothetical protein [Rhodococcus zopfii]